MLSKEKTGAHQCRLHFHPVMYCTLIRFVNLVQTQNYIPQKFPTCDSYDDLTVRELRNIREESSLHLGNQDIGFLKRKAVLNFQRESHCSRLLSSSCAINQSVLHKILHTFVSA